jgi:pentatricopeptide repeat protein
MILGHVNCRQRKKALELFHQMQQEGVQTDTVTFLGLLNACASIVALEEGRCGHEQIIQSGCKPDVFVGSSLVDKMWEHGGCLESVQEDAILRCGPLECHDIGKV